MYNLSVKDAYQAALQRYLAKQRANPAESMYNRKKVVKTPDSDIYEGLPDDFFVDHWPMDIRGSRAMSDEERKNEAERKNLENNRWLMKEEKKQAIEQLDFRRTPSLIYEGPFLSFSGYSQMNRNIVRSLRKCGVTVRTVIDDTEENVSPEEIEYFRGLSEVKVHPQSPHIYGMTIPSVISGNAYNILYTMMETSNHVHSQYAGKVNLAKEVWVPTEYAKKIMEASGVHIPINVIPLGVDTSMFNEHVAPMLLPAIPHTYKFLSVFNWGFRKGFDVLLRTFFRAFTSDDDVCLVICSKLLGGVNGRERISGIIRDFRQNAMKDNPDPPKAYLIHGNIPEKRMPSLYRACDAFVLVSRGEGFGLPFCEAGACNMPVIASNCTAQSCFLNEENSYLVNPDGFAKAKITDGGPNNMAKTCHFYENQEFPVFGRKAEESLIKIFRKVRYSYEESRLKASLLCQRVSSEYTWERTTAKMLSRLTEIMER